MLRDQKICNTTSTAAVPVGIALRVPSSSMSKRVYHLLCRIPSGSVTTYGELGRALETRGFRAIGRILNSNPNAPVVPCHRVVMKDGTLGGYAGGVEKKKTLLNQEGVEVTEGRVLEFSSRLYTFTREDQESAADLGE
jgi:methylated-DNA-[protein]-cysteine S-methyltransferase